MRKIWTNYFYYSRSDRNGVIALSALSLILFVVPKFLSIYSMPAKTVDYNAFKTEIIAVQNSLSPDNPEEATISSSNEPLEIFPFNPNTATTQDFIQLGLSPKVATIINNYRVKGGHFYKKEDLKKIYGLAPADYARLEPFINIEARDFSSLKYGDNIPPQYATDKEIKLMSFDPNIATENDFLSLGIDQKVVKNVLKYREKGGKFFKKDDLKKIYGFSELDFLRLENYIQISGNQDNTNANIDKGKLTYTSKKEAQSNIGTIDLNKASTSELLQLQGIGVTFATRIIDQREKLGGFASIEQLKEVWGLPDSTYRTIISHLKISTSVYRKIYINKATFETISHPYLTRKQVDVIVRYRLNHGDFKSIDELKMTGVLSTNILDKLKPYIDFN